MKLHRILLIILAFSSASVIGFTVFKDRINGPVAAATQSPMQQAFHNTARLANYAMISYLQAHGDRFPDASHWEEAIRPYWSVPPPFSVEVPGYPPLRLALNKRLSGASIYDPDVDSNTPLFCATWSLKPNASGAPPQNLSFMEHMERRRRGEPLDMMVTVDGYFPNE